MFVFMNVYCTTADEHASYFIYILVIYLFCPDVFVCIYTAGYFI